jgi:hypothetical protein
VDERRTLCLHSRQLFTICGNTTQRGLDLAIWKEMLRGRTDRRTSPVRVLVYILNIRFHLGELAL